MNDEVTTEKRELLGQALRFDKPYFDTHKVRTLAQRVARSAFGIPGGQVVTETMTFNHKTETATWRCTVNKGTAFLLVMQSPKASTIIVRAVLAADGKEAGVPHLRDVTMHAAVLTGFLGGSVPIYADELTPTFVGGDDNEGKIPH